MRRRTWLCVIAVTLIPYSRAPSAQAPSDPAELVRQLGQFRAAISPGRPGPVEQRRAALYIRLRTLGASAIPALRLGLADSDVQIKRNVALYLSWEGANYAKHAPEPLDLKPFLPQLVVALRDEDERVKELAAQTIAHIGSPAVIAVPDLLRMLESPSEGLRNSACIGLAGIGPPATEALPALRRALSDPSIDVRRFAQRAIDRITVRQKVERTPRGTGTSSGMV
jgi:HEAT repeat protein